jgi:hypothetical protein
MAEARHAVEEEVPRETLGFELGSGRAFDGTHGLSGPFRGGTPWSLRQPSFTPSDMRLRWGVIAIVSSKKKVPFLYHIDSKNCNHSDRYLICTQQKNGQNIIWLQYHFTDTLGKPWGGVGSRGETHGSNGDKKWGSCEVMSNGLPNH